jgi:hypothetical protein
MTQSKQIGRVIRVEWNTDTDGVLLVLEITDDDFKSKVLHSRDLENILIIDGKSVSLKE